MKLARIAPALLTLLFGGTLSAQAPLPALTGSVTIGGTGGWDYVAVDPATHHVYVSHESRMHVIDPVAGKVVAEIPGIKGVHGIAFVPEGNLGFITCGKENALAVIDLATSQTLARIATGSKPDGVLYDPFTRRVFVSDNDGASLTVVDPRTRKVVGTVKLAGTPESAQSDGAGKLYVNLEDTSQVQCIDARSLEVLATWSLAPHATPTGMAIDAAHNRLFVGCRSGHLVVLDLLTGNLKAAVPIGAGVDACAFDPETRRVFASCKEGTFAVIAAETPDAYTLVGNVKTEAGSKTMTLDASTHKLYVPAAGKAKAGFQLLEFKQ